MDNQQERTEIAWLAGLIEGEGWFSLCRVKNRQKNGSTITYKPVIGVCNSDQLLMRKVEEILVKHSIKYSYQVRNKNKDKVCMGSIVKKPIIEISVAAHDYVLKFLDLIYPFIFGEKKKRANHLYEYIKLRKSKPRSGINSRHGEEENKIYVEMYSYKGQTQFSYPQRLNAEGIYCTKI